MTKKIICLILILLIISPFVSVSADFISEKEAILAGTSKMGSYGRFYIPSVKIDVALYLTGQGDSAQTIVDRVDSAAYNTSFFGGCGFIADHYNQGFIEIKKCKIGCYAYIKTPDNSLEVYECVDAMSGTNTGDDLLTKDKVSISEVDWADFCCYTCDGNWRNIYMVFFKKKEPVLPIFKVIVSPQICYTIN